MISPKSTSTSARYSAENHVAYQSGNAANVAPPATMSHTSLPSQNGPIVLIATRRSRSVLPDDGVQRADAEVEPLEDEEPRPEEGDDDEPDDLQAHVESPSR